MIDTISSPETRVFILVALARVNMRLMFTRGSATRIKTRVSGLAMIDTVSNDYLFFLQFFSNFLHCVDCLVMISSIYKDNSSDP